MKKKIKTIFSLFILLVITLIIVFSYYMKKTYVQVPFEELYFYIFNGVSNSDSGMFIGAIMESLPYIVIIYSLMIIILYDISFGKMKSKLYPFKSINRHRGIIIFVLFIISCLIGLYNLNFFKYVKNTSTSSNFIELNYVNPKNVNISFREKRNLIFIVSESLETSFFTKSQGGYWNYEVTPELYKLLAEDDVVTFYDNNKAQGMKMIKGAAYTTASVFANTSGLPFKVPIDGNSYHSENFMNGSYTLGDLLSDNGYYNELISSARTSFGGIKEYFTRHGNYSIIDVDSLEKYNLNFTNDDLGSWGFNDNYLFDVAKTRLSSISKKDKPFNLALITIDTHAKDGFIGKYSESKFKTQYENVYATQSKLIYDFVNWVRGQDFYDNTTIVIVGDHLSMQSEYFSSRNIKDRYVYSCIINSGIKNVNNSHRQFTALDTYPTIISAIGGKVQYDRLGLGVDLFSGKKTMIERYGFGYVNEELSKKSQYYDEYIIDDDYINNNKKIGNKCITLNTKN